MRSDIPSWTLTFVEVTNKTVGFHFSIVIPANAGIQLHFPPTTSWPGEDPAIFFPAVDARIKSAHDGSIFLLPCVGEGGEMRFGIEPDEGEPTAASYPSSSFRRTPESSFMRSGAPSWTLTFVRVTNWMECRKPAEWY